MRGQPAGFIDMFPIKSAEFRFSLAAPSISIAKSTSVNIIGYHCSRFTLGQCYFSVIYYYIIVFKIFVISFHIFHISSFSHFILCFVFVYYYLDLYFALNVFYFSLRI